MARPFPLLSMALAVLASTLLVAGCPRATPTPPPVAPAPRAAVPAPARPEVAVLAAASLTEALTALKPAAEAKLGARVSISFGGSQELRTSLENGNAADVFASANMDHLEALQKKGLLKDAFAFAHGRLALIVPKSNPAGISSLAELGRKKVRLVVAVKDCPVGKYTRKLLEKCDTTEGFGGGFSAKVLESIVSEETDVKQVLAKVRVGAAEAGFVYASDVTPDARREVQEIEIPAAVQQSVTYGAGIPTAAKNAEGGRAFLEYVVSDEGRKAVLAACSLDFISPVGLPWKRN